MTTVRSYLRSGSYIAVCGFVAAVSAQAQASAALDTVRAVARLDQRLAQSADLLEREVWPGYRYDSLGLMFMIPGLAKLAVRPPADIPTGMRALPGYDKAWWADTQRVSWSGGLPVVTVSAAMTRGQAIALALHEAFHAHESRIAEPGRRFGRGENSLLTAQYPVFDVQNEAMLAVEGRLLVAALRAPTEVEARLAAGQFAAVRARRYSELDPRFVEYERLTELHEGLAQYVYLRGLAVLSSGDPALQADAARELATESEVLERAANAVTRSARRRSYATGSHIGLVLDRVSGTAWKHRVVDDDAWLDELLANAVGSVPVSPEMEMELDAAVAAAARAISALARDRNRVRDSLLAVAGTRIVLQSVKPLNWCGFDPQNLLTTVGDQLLHMRFLQLCAGRERAAEFARPIVEERITGTWHVVATDSVHINASGQRVSLPRAGESVVLEEVEIVADGVALRARRALLIGGRDGTLQVVLL